MRLAAALGLALAPLAARAQAQLVRDINPAGTSRNYTDLIVASEDAVLFTADDGTTGPALWRTDGTTLGTNLVVDLIGPTGFFPAQSTARAVGPLVYFLVSDGFTGVQPWRSDGSDAGTFRLTDPQAGSDEADTFAGLTRYRDSIAFEYATKLWLSNGQMGGTALAPAQIQLSNLPLAAVDDALYVYGTFPGAPGAAYGLVLSDGSVAGTSLVQADIAAFQPVAVNGRLYFVYDAPTTGAELYALDAGASSVHLVKDIVNGFASSNPQHLTRVADRLFFSASDPVAGTELWVSDGTEGGTQRVKDIVPGNGSSNPTALTALGTELYFAATTPEAGTELWRSDGSEAGTEMVEDLDPGPESGLTGAASYNSAGAIAAVNGRVFIQGRPDHFGVGARLWLLDPAGQALQPVDESTLSIGPLVPFNGRLLFTGGKASGTGGLELYAADLLGLAGNTWCARPEAGLRDGTGSTRFAFLLPDRGNVYKPTVSLDLGHSYVGDLSVSLRHRESATTVVLLDHPGSGLASGGCASDLIDIRLSDDAPAAANDECALSDQRLAYPRGAHYRPVQALSAFAGEALAGYWEIEIADSVSGNAGTLHEWCLSWSGPLIFRDDFEDPLL